MAANEKIINEVLEHMSNSKTDSISFVVFFSGKAVTTKEQKSVAMELLSEGFFYRKPEKEFFYLTPKGFEIHNTIGYSEYKLRQEAEKIKLKQKEENERLFLQASIELSKSSTNINKMQWGNAILTLIIIGSGLYVSIKSSNDANMANKLLRESIERVESEQKQQKIRMRLWSEGQTLNNARLDSLYREMAKLKTQVISKGASIDSKGATDK